MIDNHFRKVMPKMVDPIIKILMKLRVKPNQVTVFAFLVSSSSVWFVLNNYFILAALIWWTGRILDGMDGILARASKTTSSFGAYLDIVLDMAAYSLFIVGLSIRFPELQFNWILILGLYVLCITSALSFGSLLGEKEIKDNRGLKFGAGLAEAGETGIAYTLFMIFPKHIAILSLIWIGVLLITVLARTSLAYKTLKG